MPIDKDAVVRLLSDKAYRPLTLPELEAHLALSEEEKPKLAPMMEELVHAGLVVALRGQRYGLPQRMNLITGILQAHPNGYAFLIPDKAGERAADVFIGRSDLADAMHGDKVVVRVERTSRMGRPEGKVIRILERRVRRIVGEYQVGSGFGYVVPAEGRHLHHIYIPKGKDKRALSGQLVVAEIRQYPEGNRDPEGEIIRVLGNRNDPDVERDVIIERYGLSTRFPTDVLTDAKMVSQKVDPKELGLRVDLRALKVFTIDGENAKDFDDAVAIARSGEGRYKLWVSIADVAHYVPADSPLDKEARARATSVYFSDRVVPMLPEELSNGICSLNPHVERLAMTAELEFDSEGKLISSQFYDSVIVSKERLTYTEVKRILVDRDEEVLGRYRYLEDDLRLMEELALKLKSRRDDRGSLDFDLPQPFVLLDLEGNIEAIVRAERNIAHRLVEEFMLVANEAVASFLSKEDLPSLYRCHDEPDPAKLEDLRYFLHNLNLKLDVKVTPKALQRLLRQVQGKPLEKLVNEVTLRTMKHAYYTPRNVGHFGLASDQYLHFTSPIRRYPDLIIHRILKSVLERGGMSERQREGLKGSLGDTAAHCSERERNAEKAEREALALKKTQFMQRYVGEEFEGYISGVTSFGFFVELRELFVDGLVHVSSLGDDYYEYREREHELIGQGTKRAFRLADKVRVKVARVDLDKRHIDFALVADAVREQLTPQQQPARSGRPMPNVNLEPAHPESGDGRGRLRKPAKEPYSNRIPQRAPRPEEHAGEEEGGRRQRGDRGERGERPERGERGERPERGERGERPERGSQQGRSRRESPQQQNQTQQAQAPSVPALKADNEIIPLETPPPLSPESATIPPPMLEEGALASDQAEQPLGPNGEPRRKRRRRGGRGRRRRGANEGAPSSADEAEGEDEGSDDADDTVEDSAAVPGAADSATPNVVAEATGEAVVEQTAKQPERRERREPREPREPRPPRENQAPREVVPVPAPADTSDELSDGDDDTDDGDDDGSAPLEAGHEGELAFVAKRRRRRRGGRGRRKVGDKPISANGHPGDGQSAEGAPVASESVDAAPRSSEPASEPSSENS